MTPRDLVVFLENDEGCSQRLRYAAGLARRWQAHLIATFVTPPLALEPHVGFAVGEALSSAISEHDALVADAIARTRSEFERLVNSRSFTGEWRESRNESGEQLMLHARHASLGLLGPPARQAVSMSSLSLAENMIFASGRPCLLLPAGWPDDRMARHVVVGWNGGREATRAIADAMPFLVAAESVALVVVPDARVQALYGEDPGADMAAHLARQGVRVELEQCAGDDAGAVLLERCASGGTDLLVMGAKGRSRVSELVLGGATRSVLGRVHVPLLLSQ